MRAGAATGITRAGSQVTLLEELSERNLSVFLPCQCCARGCALSRSRRYSSSCAWPASEVGGLGFVLAWGDLFRLEKPRERANGDENATADRDVLELPNLYEVADLPLGDPDAPSELLRRFQPLIIVRHRLAPSIT